MTTREHDRTMDLLSEYLDGSLSVADHREVEAHLETCAPCRGVLDDLREVVTNAEGLGPMEPPRDLWPEVARQLGPRGRGGWTNPVREQPWLAAAAVVLMLLSASAAWWARGSLYRDGSGAAVSAAAPSSSVGGVPGYGRDVRAAASGASPISGSMEAELGVLERVLLEGRDRLDPATVDVLERNLLVIERAIEDSYRALALDPENDFLRRHLTRTYERKLDYLRDVSRIVELAG